MLKKWMSQFFFLGLCLSSATVSAESLPDPCGGASFLLSLVDRPTVGDSACVVPFKQAVLEAGYQYQILKGSGYSQNYPEAELRIGLPQDSEFVVVLSNYSVQSKPPASGFNATVTGIKHRLSYGSNWVLTVEGLITLPSGSEDFGSKNYGGALNGIVNYNLSSQFSVTTMLGMTTQSASRSDGGRRFNSFNPDLVLSWAPWDKLNFYAEFYAQTKSSPDENFGMNCDGGALYLLSKNLTIDLEVGHRLSGNLGSFDRYIGTGFAVLF